MKKRDSLGQHELALLRFVGDSGPITVGDAAKGYGTPLGLARTTVLTMMERLRAKGYLIRTKKNGIYTYSLKGDKEDLLSGVVGEFIQRSLGGSLSPFVSYLVDTGKLSEKEIAELRRMVESLETKEAGSDS